MSPKQPNGIRAQTLAIRDPPPPSPPPDAVTSGYACKAAQKIAPLVNFNFKWRRPLPRIHPHQVDTGHADRNLNWIVCGGSGYSLRRQRNEGQELSEPWQSCGK
jgi:hypothetical protein